MTAGQKIASFIRAMTVLILVAWLLIFAFASDESRNRLTDEFKQSIDGFKQNLDR